MGAERWDEQVGSVADEAGRLLESLRRSAEAAANAAAAQAGYGPGPAEPAAGPGGARPASEHTSPHTPEHGEAGHDPVCQWCPICRGAAVVRSLSPETLTRLADLASLAAGVLADLAGARTENDPSAPATPTARTPRPAAASRPIPVRDADDPQEAPRG